MDGWMDGYLETGPGSLFREALARMDGFSPVSLVDLVALSSVEAGGALGISIYFGIVVLIAFNCWGVLGSSRL
jgi:hypothetical protein